MNNVENIKEKLVIQKDVLTLYFDPKLVNQIDEFIHQNKKNLPPNKRRKLNRTTIISKILKESFDEWAKFGHSSQLSRLLAEWIDE